MAFDGNGNYLRIHNWTSDAANGIDINAGEMDGEDNSIAAALSICVTRDGQGKMTADFLPSSDNTLNLGSGGARWATLNGVAVGTYQTNIQSAAETAAGVTPTNLQYSTSPHDIRRYGAAMDGTTDDAAAWAKLALVMGQGGSGYLPPLPTMIKSAITIAAPTNPTSKKIALFGFGCVLKTTGAFYGLTVTGGSMGGLDILGLTHDNTTDSLCLGAINLKSCQNVNVIDCCAVISGVAASSATYALVTMQPSDPTNDNTGAFWNRVIRPVTRQSAGNVTFYAPFGVLIIGASNACQVIGGNFTSVNYAIALINQNTGGATGQIANATLIEGNAFEGGIQAVLIDGHSYVAGSAGNPHIEGLRILNNRGESLSGGFLLIQGLAADSNVPMMLANNYMVSSVTAYITQNNVAALQVTVNAMDPSFTPSWGVGVTNTTQTTNGYWKWASIASAQDMAQFWAQNVNSGIGLYNSTGTLLAGRRFRLGGGAYDQFPGGADLRGIDGISRTQNVQRKTFISSATFAASTTVNVTFGTAEPDTNYMILVEANPTTGAITVSAKGTTGFTLTAASSNSQNVPYMLIGR